MITLELPDTLNTFIEDVSHEISQSKEDTLLAVIQSSKHMDWGDEDQRTLDLVFSMQEVRKLQEPS